MNKEQTIEVAKNWWRGIGAKSAHELRTKYYPGLPLLSDKEFAAIYTAEHPENKIEVDALEWWESLTLYRTQVILAKHNLTGLSVTDKLIVKIYTAEHPTAPTVENGEPLSKEEWVKEFKNLSGDYVDLIKAAWDLKQENKKLLEDNRKLNLAWDCDKAVLKELQDKLTYYEKKSIAALEDNKLLRDALQNLIIKGIQADGNDYQKAIDILEQTK